MELTYHTRRRLKRGILTGLGIALAITLVWTCWVVWVKRYVVFTREGAVIDFSLSQVDPGWVYHLSRSIHTDLAHTFISYLIVHITWCLSNFVSCADE